MIYALARASPYENALRLYSFQIERSNKYGF